jgi:hypothetical protein
MFSSLRWDPKKSISRACMTFQNIEIKIFPVEIYYKRLFWYIIHLGLRIVIYNHALFPMTINFSVTQKTCPYGGYFACIESLKTTYRKYVLHISKHTYVFNSVNLFHYLNVIIFMNKYTLCLFYKKKSVTPVAHKRNSVVYFSHTLDSLSKFGPRLWNIDWIFDTLFIRYIKR